ncbi:prepilin-type N-terminal cleavage/methylation domain-containing protein [Colwelliaceae bacterium BS250]
MKHKKIQGFGLIEVLVALAIMAVGLLAIASFQSGLIGESSSNKARAEAIGIAQQRIEQLRNYSAEAFSQDDFNVTFADITDGNSTDFTGSNSIFTRTETIADPNDTKEIEIKVSWIDESGASQSVALTTEVSWESPSLAGELDDTTDKGPLVRSATGRAELGDGKVLDGEKPTAVLGDLIGIIDRGDGDLRLTSGDDVVLTLKDACLLDDEGTRTNVDCTQFVEISGRVFIDQTSKPTDPTDVYVIASDAAFCQRYYYVGGFDDDNNSIDVPTDIASVNTADLATGPNGDYLYYNYTCFLGGGWHGNIGLIVTAKNNSQDSVKACVGDPTSADAYADPEVAIRRVYRGMAFKYLDDAQSQIEKNGDNIVYYTVGVADALILPDPDDIEQAPHDFVISTLASNNGAECISEGIMVRDDANVNGVRGDLFDGNPTAFVCLNANPAHVDSIKLDALNYGVDSACPFDPSDPPNTKHAIDGTISIAAESSPINDTLIAATKINTSDGPLNCTISSTAYVDTGYVLSYSCDVYQWSNPWVGYIEVKPDLSVFNCTSYKQSFTGVEADKSGVNFSCEDPAYTNPGGGVVYGDFAVSGTITGSVTSVSIDDVNGICDVNLGDFICKTASFDNTTTWSGKITFDVGNSQQACLSAATPEVNSVEAVSSGGSTISFTNVSAGTVEVNVETMHKNDTCNY